LEAAVAGLLIRHVDVALHQRLKARAAAHRRSLEEEVRALLRAAVAGGEAPRREGLAALARRLFGPEGGAELAVPPRGGAERAVPDFAGTTFDPPGGR
jgi:plasmid stability protein